MSTIVGMFDDHRRAERAINELDALGLDEGSIHTLTRSQVAGDSDIITSVARALGPGTGAVSGELIRLGLDREAAEFYEEELADESIIIAVQADGETGDRAMEILQGANAAVRDD